MHTFVPVLASAAALAALPTLAAAQQLQEPFRVEANGKPIAVDVGHAAPYVHDFDGDGVRDLLVGQFGGPGHLRIYRNSGSDTSPKFGDFEKLMAGGQIASVPAS